MSEPTRTLIVVPLSATVSVTRSPEGAGVVVPAPDCCDAVDVPPLPHAAIVLTQAARPRIARPSRDFRILPPYNAGVPGATQSPTAVAKRRSLVALPA